MVAPTLPGKSGCVGADLYSNKHVTEVPTARILGTVFQTRATLAPPT